jgi:hypothetical protein
MPQSPTSWELIRLDTAGIEKVKSLSRGKSQKANQGAVTGLAQGRKARAVAAGRVRSRCLWSFHKPAIAVPARPRPWFPLWTPPPRPPPPTQGIPRGGTHPFPP